MLFSLSALQQVASKKYGFSAKEVLDTAQALYEKHKATTYPRTDCQYLPNAQFDEVKEVLKAVKESDSDISSLIDGADTAIKSKVFDDKKLTAHNAIIPIASKVDISAMNDKEFKLYDLIRKYYIDQFYPKYEYDQTVITIKAADEIFTANINIVVNLGWKSIITETKKDQEQTIPKIEVGEELITDKVELEAKKTKPPARYAEGSLIGAMEKAHLFVTDEDLKKILKGNEGIGTEATRANIIETLFAREVIKKDKKNIISTEKGRTLIDTVPAIIKDPGMTAIMESSLNKVANNELSLDEYIKSQIEFTNKLINAIKTKEVKELESDVECPNCKKSMHLRKGQYGAFWACSGYPECKTTTKDNNGKPIFEKSEAFNCPECNKTLRRIKGKKGYFWSCKGYFDKPQCKFTAKDKNKKPVLEKMRV